MNKIEQAKYYAKLFFKEMEDCQYTLDQPSIQFSKGKRNLEKIRKNIANTKFTKPENMYFTPQKKSQNILYTKAIIHQLYNGMYDEQVDMLLSLFHVNHELPPYESGICGDYNQDTRTMQFTEGKIWSWKNPYIPITLTHEITHAFFKQVLPPIGFNYNYNELCSIFAEQYGAFEMDQDLDKGKGYLNHCMQIRFHTLQQHFQEYETMQHYLAEFNVPNESLSPVQLAFKFSYYNSYQYIICSIYGTLLFLQYLQMPESVLTDFRKTVVHEMTIPTLLDKYEISLRNPESVNEFQKVISKYSI